MFLKKFKPLKTSLRKSKLDHVLWFIDKYLPKKKGIVIRKDLFINIFKARDIFHIHKLASLRSKSFSLTLMNNKLSFTFGSWAKPYLKLLNQLGLTK